MTIERFETSARLAQAVVRNGTIYLAGQVGEEGASIIAQSEQAMASIDRLLAIAGSDRSKILQATVWLATMEDFAAFNSVWEGWVDPLHSPARSTAQVALVSPSHRVEITVVASVE